MNNLLTHPLLTITTDDSSAPVAVTLPGLLARLVGDGVAGYPALRPHQAPAWHMFLVQLAALALHRSGETALPSDEAAWCGALRALTPDFAGDEPWCLVVDDPARPAFLQPPVPPGVELKIPFTTPDALDLLITSRNHDLKQTVAMEGQPQDWVFALVSLQTGEGYGGAGNQGIARMNGGSSSRPLLTLAPRPSGPRAGMSPRPGARFVRDVSILLDTRMAGEEKSGLDYPEEGGVALVWLEPWEEERQLQTKQLDPWFIEVCRRIRLFYEGDRLIARKGTSKATRINAKHLKGALDDPFAPVHRTEGKAFTLSGRDFDYRVLLDLLFSGNWSLPVLARPHDPHDTRDGPDLVLVAEALSRGNSKTEGFKSRILPLSKAQARAMRSRRATLNDLAKEQVEEIAVFDKALSGALALCAARGEYEARTRDHYGHAAPARARLDRAADGLFFPHLWHRFDAQVRGQEAMNEAREAFTRALWEETQTIFEESLPAIPCTAIFRPRAEARARRALSGSVRHTFPALFTTKEPANVPA